jgi:hypothetical protein
LVVSWGVAVATAATVSTVRPGTDGTIAALVAIGIETVGAAVLVAWLHRRGAAWADVGLTRPGHWQSRTLLAALGALTLLPLAAGVRSPGSMTTVAVLVTGYALTGFTGHLPVIPVFVAQDVALLTLGTLLLRRVQPADASAAVRTPDPGPSLA